MCIHSKIHGCSPERAAAVPRGPVPSARQLSSSSSDSPSDSGALSGKSSPICWKLPDCASHMYLMVTLNSAISYPKSFCRRQRDPKVRRSEWGQRSLRPLPPQLRTPGAGGTHQDAGLLRGQHIALLAHLVVGQQGHHTCREGGPQAVTLAQRPVQGRPQASSSTGAGVHQ